MNDDNKELVFEEYNDDTEQNGDKYAVVSVRISKEILKKLEEIQTKTNMSRNALIRKYVDFGIEHTRLIKREPE